MLERGLVSRILFPVPQPSYSAESWPHDLIWVPKRKEAKLDGLGPGAPLTPDDERVPCLLLTYPSARYLIIFFHSNAEDLGRCRSFCCYLREQFQVHVLAVEYPGYGICPGSPSGETVMENALAGLHFAVHGLKWPLDSIKVFGRSIGTGPAVALAASFNFAGCILVTPFLSVQELFRDRVGPFASLIEEWFANGESAPKIVSPTLIIHGQRDELIACRHGEELYELLLARKLLVSPPDMEHNTNLLTNLQCFVLPMFQFFPLPDYIFLDIEVPRWAYHPRGVPPECLREAVPCSLTVRAVRMEAPSQPAPGEDADDWVMSEREEASAAAPGTEALPPAGSLLLGPQPREASASAPGTEALPPAGALLLGPQPREASRADLAEVDELPHLLEPPASPAPFFGIRPSQSQDLEIEDKPWAGTEAPPDSLERPPPSVGSGAILAPALEEICRLREIPLLHTQLLQCASLEGRAEEEEEQEKEAEEALKQLFRRRRPSVGLVEEAESPKEIGVGPVSGHRNFGAANRGVTRDGPGAAWTAWGDSNESPATGLKPARVAEVAAQCHCENTVWSRWCTPRGRGSGAAAAQPAMVVDLHEAEDDMDLVRSLWERRRCESGLESESVAVGKPSALCPRGAECASPRAPAAAVAVVARLATCCHGLPLGQVMEAPPSSASTTLHSMKMVSALSSSPTDEELLPEEALVGHQQLRNGHELQTEEVVRQLGTEQWQTDASFLAASPHATIAKRLEDNELLASAAPATDRGVLHS